MPGDEDKKDFELVKQYRRGDKSAMEQLVERHQRKLFGFILKMTADRSVAEEVFQEVWFRALKKIDSYNDKCFAAWIMRIARNLVIDRVRAKRNNLSLDKEYENGGTLQDVLPSPAASPVEQAAENDMRAQLTKAISTLPEEQREVCILRIDSGLSFKEIAVIQGVSINTALARMQYAVEKLRNMIPL